MALASYHETLKPWVQADETAVTLSTTNKALVPAARYGGMGSQFFDTYGKRLRIRAFGKITTGTTPGNLTIAVFWGTGADANGTSLGATAAAALTASQTNISWEFEAYIHCRGTGATGSLFTTGRFCAGPAVIATTLSPMFIPASAAVVVGSLDLTGSSVPSLQALRSGSTAETMTVQDFSLDPMN